MKALEKNYQKNGTNNKTALTSVLRHISGTKTKSINRKIIKFISV